MEKTQLGTNLGHFGTNAGAGGVNREASGYGDDPMVLGAKWREEAATRRRLGIGLLLLLFFI